MIYANQDRWSHADFAQISQDQVDSEVTLLENAFFSLIGMRPACMLSKQDRNKADIHRLPFPILFVHPGSRQLHGRSRISCHSG
jgi:hypothetical protein